MNRIPGDIDRLAVAFDEESLVSDAGLLAVGTLMKRLGLEGLLDETVRMGGRVGGSHPGRKILSLVVSMLLGGSHIDHADRLRAGSTPKGVAFWGDGVFDFGNVSSFVHMGSCPPVGQSTGRDTEEVLVGRWGSGRQTSDHRRRRHHL